MTKAKITEKHFDKRNSDFDRDHSVAQESFITKTMDTLIVRKRFSSESISDVDTTELIHKLSDCVIETDQDI